MESVLDSKELPVTSTRATYLLGYRSFLLVCGLFVLSGACGLGYEVVWAKFLGHFLGNTVLLHTAVLGTFVGGLALGSLAIGKVVSKIKSPLKLYGFLEIGVAAYAIVFPQLSDLGQNLIYSAARSMPPGAPTLIIIKMLCGAVLLAVPTLLMGATFPVLTAHVERSRTTMLGSVGANWLYFANCCGAVMGTLLTGFYLIPTLGLTGTVLGIALLNLSVGFVAVIAERFLPADESAQETRERDDEREKVKGYSRDEKLILLSISLSGATAFFYELVWTRFFAVMLGSSTYSFTLMLAAFITGLALGSVFSGMVPTAKKPIIWFATAEVLIGVVMILSVPLYPHLPYWFWQWKWLLRPTEASIGLYQVVQYGIIVLGMVLPTFLFGLTFPTAIKAASESVEGKASVAPRAAAVYGWNTVGTLLGTLLAGFLLIPFFGLMRTLQVGAVINLAIGALLLPIPLTARRWMIGMCVPAVLALVLTPHWKSALFTVGIYRQQSAPPPTFKTFSDSVMVRQPVFYREDFGTTVAVVPTVDDITKQEQLTLIVDGKPDASSVSDLPTQVLLGQLPLLFKPDAKDVFVLGLGSGTSVGSVLTHPVERVDCVELSPTVVDAAHKFIPADKPTFRDPRLHLYVDDGKTFLAAANHPYDVIISEPTNPWIAGVGGLFTREAFESQRQKLKPGGIVAQWFHSYSLDDRLVATILRTFQEVFPHTIIFQGCVGDYIILGSEQPLVPDYKALAERLQRPEVAAVLKPIHITNVPTLLAAQTHTEDAAKALTKGGGLNTDDYPLLEYMAPFAFYVGDTAESIRNTDCRLQSGSGLLMENYQHQNPLTQSDYQSIIQFLEDHRISNDVLLGRVLKAYTTQWPDDVNGSLAMVRFLYRQNRKDEALTVLSKVASSRIREAQALVTRLTQEIKQQQTNVFFRQ